MSSFNGGKPASPKLRLAVLGDSDSHSFHDAVSLHYGTPEARGGAQQASTWQWTEILGRLRPRDIDQGPFGEVGSSGAGAWLRRNVMGSLVRQHKEDFRYNFAFSGATCGALNKPTLGQGPRAGPAPQPEAEGRQGEFEFRQAFIAQRAAETDNGGLADGGAFGNFSHGGMDKPFRLGQGAFGHFAFRTRQVVQGLADFIQHIFLLILLFDFQTASRHTVRPSENTVCRFLTTRACPPKPPPRR